MTLIIQIACGILLGFGLLALINNLAANRRAIAARTATGARRGASWLHVRRGTIGFWAFMVAGLLAYAAIVGMRGELRAKQVRMWKANQTYYGHR